MQGTMATLPEVLAPFPVCSDLVSLRFDGRMLILSIPGGVKQYPAVSGKFHGDFSVRAQQDKNLGPIPTGAYWIDPEQMWTAPRGADVVAEIPYFGAYYAGWGHHRITIHVMPGTKIYGRKGFFIHGGSHQGSGGCIHVTGSGMDQFRRDLIAALKGLPACSVPLLVAYPQ
jgi:hypothetical protein